MPDQQPLSINAQGSQLSVLVPCPPEAFADFMSKLLGKPQSAHGSFSGIFEIKLHDVENFYYLIHHRVTEQNKGQLIQFIANIYYTDGTSVEVQTLEGLKSYSEVKPLVSTGVLLTWIYLVTFNNSLVPEKQQIEVFIETQRNRVAPTQWTTTHDYPRYLHPSHLPSRDRIGYSISYTARTWGADIENLLRDHIGSLIIREPSSLRRFVQRWDTYLMNFLALSLFMMFFRVGVWIADWLSRKYASRYNEISKSGLAIVDQIAKKIDYIHETIAGPLFVSAMSLLLFYVVGTLILSYIASTMVMEKASARRPSFVILTRSSEQDKDSRLATYETSWTVFIATAVFAVGIGVVGNIVTWYVWG